jgi:hypothetical protein
MKTSIKNLRNGDIIDIRAKIVGQRSKNYVVLEAPGIGKTGRWAVVSSVEATLVWRDNGQSKQR